MSDFDDRRASELEQPPGFGLPSGESVASFLASAARLFATIMGIVVMAFGLWAALRLFGALYAVLMAPDGFKGSFQAWTEAVGGNDVTFPTPNGPVVYAPILAAGLFGLVAFVLIALCLGMLTAGAKIISWTAGDREAVRKILEHALGRSRVEGD